MCKIAVLFQQVLFVLLSSANTEGVYEEVR